MESELTASIIIGYVIVSLLEWAKGKSWVPLVNHFNSATANRTVAAVLAVISSIGIHAQYDGAAGSLVITGLTFATILPSIAEVIKQFVIQQMIYKGIIEKEKSYGFKD